MICVLSVMNGFGALVEQMFSEFDPVLLVVPSEGETLRTDAAPIRSLYAREDIEAISMQLEQTALIRYKDHQLPARVMGVDSLFTSTAHIDSIINDGFFSVWDGAFERAVLGRGLAAQIGINAHFTGALHLYAPERTGRINMLRPDLSLRHEYTFIAGTFAVNQIDYDDQLMLVSLPLAQRLFDYDEHTATALRIQPKGVQSTDRSTDRIKTEIAQTLGSGYKVLDRYEQQADFFNILRIEKLLTILLLVFILLTVSPRRRRGDDSPHFPARRMVHLFVGHPIRFGSRCTALPRSRAFRVAEDGQRNGVCDFFLSGTSAGARCAVRGRYRAGARIRRSVVPDEKVRG